tara:strand:- start:478 stop:1830 length:1353 start_codon:yes stop_codon:yes gene_type:complete
VAINENLLNAILGASGTNLTNIGSGALQGLLGKERKPIDPALLALIGFTDLGAQASKPGATLFGAGNVALGNVAKTYLQDQRDVEKSNLARATGLITLASQLNKPKAEKAYTFTKDTTIDGVEYKKGKTKFFTNQAFNILEPEIKANIVPYTAPKGQIETYISQFDGNLYHKSGPFKGKRVEDDSGNYINYDEVEQSSIGTDETKVDIFEQKDDSKPSSESVMKPLNLKDKENYIKLKDKYAGKDAVKDYNKKLGHMDNVFTSYNQIYSLDRPGAGDLALIFSFMKMLDPNSVVREGEFAVARKVGGPADWLVQYANYVKNGGILSDFTRKSFRDLAYAQYKNAVTNLELQNSEEIKSAGPLGLEKPVVESYLKSPKQFVIEKTYKVLLPKKRNKKELQDFFLQNNYTLDDIEYMLGGENVKEDEEVKNTIKSILKDILEKKIILKPNPR